MKAWSLLKLSLLFAAAGACGGQTIASSGPPGPNDPTNPGNPANPANPSPPSSTNPAAPNNPNAPNPPGVPTIAQGGDFTILPGLGAGRPDLTTLVGSSPTDIWGAGTDNGLYHWDGQAWTPVTLGPPASVGNLKGQLASAGVGKVWIAHQYGVVRVDTSGTAQDFTSQIAPSVNDTVGVDASADMTVVTDYDKGASGVFYFDGAKFTTLPTVPSGLTEGSMEPASVAVRSAKDVWVPSGDNEGAYFDGAAWHGMSFLYFGSVVPFAPAKMAEFEVPATVCPGWCHPGSPPYGETSSAAWTGIVVDMTQPNGGSGVTPPAPAGLDPSLAYVGVAAEPAKDLALALVGCAFGQASANNDGEYVGQYVVHEWDGTALHARVLATPPECAFQAETYGGAGGDIFAGLADTGTGVAGARPLTDGTWILPAVGSGGTDDPYVGAAAVLMTP